MKLEINKLVFFQIDGVYSASSVHGPMTLQQDRLFPRPLVGNGRTLLHFSFHLQHNTTIWRKILPSVFQLYGISLPLKTLFFNCTGEFK